MGDTAASSSAAPVVAPAAPASTPIDASAAPSVGATPAPVEATPLPDAGTTSTPADGQPSFPTHDSFTWDKWDGSVDALPDPVRGWASKLSEHYTKTAEEARAEAQFVQRTYEELLAGRPDPRLQKLEADLQARVKELEGFQGTQKQWEQKVAQAEAKAAELENAWTSFQEQQARAEADAFKDQHPWLFESDATQALALELLEEGFELNDLPVVMRQPDQVLAKTRTLRKELAGAKNATQHALRLARIETDITPSNPAAALVASGSRIASTHEPLNKVQGDSLHDALDRVLTAELRKRG